MPRRRLILGAKTWEIRHWLDWPVGCIRICTFFDGHADVGHVCRGPVAHLASPLLHTEVSMQKVELEGCIQLRLRGGQDARERPCSFPCTLESDVWSSNSGAFVLPQAWALPPPKTSCLPSSQLPSQIVNRILPITTAGRAATPLSQRHAMGAMGDCCRGPVSIFLQEHAFACD